MPRKIFLWAKQLGGTDIDYATAITVDVLLSNVYVTGDFNGTADFDPGGGQYTVLHLPAVQTFLY